MTLPFHALNSTLAGSTMSGDNLLSQFSNDHCNDCQKLVPAHLRVGLSYRCGLFHIESFETVMCEARRNVDFKKRPQALPMSEFNCSQLPRSSVWRTSRPRRAKEPETPKPSAPPNLYPHIRRTKLLSGTQNLLVTG